MDFEPYKCLSFDCYGTLIDWESGLLAALRELLGSHDIEAGDDDALLERYAQAEAAVESESFRPYREVLQEALEQVGESLGFRPSSAESEAFSISVKHWPAFPDSAQALQKLADRYRLIVLSNIDNELFDFSRPRLGVDFDAVFTAQQIGSYKPSQRNFEYLIEHAGLEKHTILHVAQSLYHDIVPAKEAGLATAWIDRRSGREGYGATPPPTQDADPDLVAADLRSFAEMALAHS